ncbi:uncharacterized protein [Branchiostoma lanceolatum]|uniref:uncharacterized protein n=1 Tax=Branchiostoma lanceolatum TaxID=7740 RepID=UPI003454D167
MVWVADRYKTHLQVYSLEGVYLCQFPTGAPGLGYPSKRPSDVSIDDYGHLWVLMIGYPASPDSVVQFSRDGHLKASFDLPDTVPRGVLRGMAMDLRNNHVFVTWSGGYGGGVQAFGNDGKVLWDVSSPQRMKRPMNVAVDGKGNIFVSDVYAHLIYIYDETGQYVSKFGGQGRSGGRLNRPRGICADRSIHGGLRQRPRSDVHRPGQTSRTTGPSNTMAPLSVTLSVTHHSVHIHGHAFQVVGMGYPSYDRTTGHFLQPNADIQCTNDLCTGATWRDGPPTLNLKNPPMKDTVLVPVNGYIVVRFRSDNPGYWLLHCQNDQHMNEGMALVLREAADRHPSPPEGFPRCGDFTWSSAENEHALGGEAAKQCEQKLVT